MNEMIRTIKEVNPDAVCLYKVGAFYHSYEKDAYILSYLFKYKIKQLGEKHKECGFPLNSLNKVIARLENLKIDYMIIDIRNNYDVDEHIKFEKENRYLKYYQEASKYLNLKRRIEVIAEYLESSINSEGFSKLLREIEDTIYERREV